jgi:hypothetical protein
LKFDLSLVKPAVGFNQTLTKDFRMITFTADSIDTSEFNENPPSILPILTQAYCYPQN